MAGQAIAERELGLADFDFDLPAGLIAQHPLPDRAASRLLHVGHGRLVDHHFGDVLELLDRDDLLVFNDTRVIKARLFGHKPSGGKVEVLVERAPEPTLALALVRTSHKPAPGSRFVFDAGVEATVEGRRDDFFELRFNRDVFTVLDGQGHVPLPPYITHPDGAVDAERYQTVYATRPGAVAAPTAGLHFTPDLLEQPACARDRAGSTDPARRRRHVPAGAQRAAGRRTACIRSATRSQRAPPTPSTPPAAPAGGSWRSARRACARSSRPRATMASCGRAPRKPSLFITPGYRFRVVDRLITNFHLPKSTLLMLVSAFAGVETIRQAYAHAIAARYRFFSYGDAMLLERAR